MSASYENRGTVAVITLNNPPVNGLGHETRKGITDALDRAAHWFRKWFPGTRSDHRTTYSF